MNRTRRVFGIAALTLLLVAAALTAEEARLLRQPTVSDSHIAFVYANDIWVAGRDGGDARRLTSHPGGETAPHFSPDGKWIAFTGQYDGNTDVYVVAAEGGSPKRLTYHGIADNVRGWTHDGSAILFASIRTNPTFRYNRLWKVSVGGGMPEPLPMKTSNRGSFSPDGSRMAYVRIAEAFNAWRRYRGGRNTEVWLINMNGYDVEKVPTENGSNDTYPMWVGSKVYFLSDRTGTMNLYSYDTGGKQIAKLTNYNDFDVKTATAGGGVIAYEYAGYIHLFDPAAGNSRKVSIEVSGDIPWKRPYIDSVAGMIRNADVSPSGKRAVFEARGDIYTVPAKKGTPRNLSQTPGAHDRSPTWSPDGKSVAWFSDEGGEYHIKIRDQLGKEPIKKIKLDNPSFYYNLAWSPDSKKLLFDSKHLVIWWVDVESGEAHRVDSDTYGHPVRSLSPSWSSDSKWITYSKRLDSHMRAIFIHNIEDGGTHQITDGLSDATSPVFDSGGKYLYFQASTNYGLNVGWLDMSNYPHVPQQGIYLVVLSSEEGSPFLPESDDEKVKEEKKAEKKDDAKKPEKGDEEKKADKEKKAEEKKDKGIRVDLDGIRNRTLAIGVPQRNYVGLIAGGKNSFFYAEAVQNQPGARLHKYDIKSRKSSVFIPSINNAVVSAKGSHILYSSRGSWAIASTKGKPKPGSGRLNTTAMRGTIDPVAEWKQIYLEGWRINRDFFYDDNFHGVDWDAVYRKYEPFIKHVSHRTDLNYVLNLMIGELTVGHARNPGGDFPNIRTTNVGLLGCDFEAADGRYKIVNIIEGENWNPNLRSPLTEPGVKVNEGDYLLAVNGVELTASMNPFSLFQGTANRQTTITVNDKPSMEGARSVNVVPLTNEVFLRHRAWIEKNRQLVDELSDGKLAYVYLPNTAGGGYSNFNRYFFSQLDKQGAVIDERFNGGGSAADYIIDLLDRPIMNYWATRDGKEFFTPTASIPGPKVMIIDELSSSGGDAMPYYFRKRGIGPLIGKRTWGGLVGVYDYPVLIDGGGITAPRVAFFDDEGNWAVENRGVAPDIEVEQTPALEIAGHDPQLEAAVKETLRLLAEKPVRHPSRPAPIDRTRPPH